MSAQTGFKRRDGGRTALTHSAVLHCGGAQVPVILQDISRGGAKVKTHVMRPGLDLSAADKLEIPGMFSAPIDVRWNANGAVGAQFDLPAHRQNTLAMQIARVIQRSKRR